MPPELQVVEESEPLAEITEEPAQAAIPAVESQLPEWLSGLGEPTESIVETPVGSQAEESPLEESLAPELQAEHEDQSLPETQEELVPVPPPAKHGNFPDWMGSLFTSAESVNEGSKVPEEPLAEEAPAAENLQTEPLPGEPQALDLAQDVVEQESVPSISIEAQEQTEFSSLPQDAFPEESSRSCIRRAIPRRSCTW